MIPFIRWLGSGGFVIALIVCLVAPPLGESLAVAPSSKSPEIKRVAVIGTGIAGLSLAHALENSPELAKICPESNIEVSLFDSRPSLDFGAGAGVQINGGMSVLRKINPEVQRAVANAALPNKYIRTRTRPWQEGEIDFDTLLEFELESTVRKAGGQAAEELIVDGELMFYTIMRGALQEAMFDTLPKDVAKRVQFDKTLTGIDSSGTEGIQVSFLDGSSEGPFDLVVGCDGIKSAVKEYIETGKVSEDAKMRKGDVAIYSGIRIRYAVQDGDESTSGIEETELRQYFGEGGYALTGTYGAGAGRPPGKMTFIIFLDQDYIGPFKKPESKTSGAVEENVNWSQDVRAPDSSRDVMLQQMKDCRIPSIEVQPIIENADRFFELGIYFHNPLSLSGWSKEVPGSGGRFCTLSGDAAHAMPPFLGQGSNQAIQDAYCLGKKIYEHNARALGTYDVSTSDLEGEEEEEEVTLKTLLKEYEQIRWAMTTSISAKAGFLGYLEASEGFPAKFRDVFFKTMFKTGIAAKIFLGAAIPKV